MSRIKKDENVVLEVKAENISKVYGWQYTLESKDLSFIAIESASANLSNQNIRRENSNLHMSYGHAVGLELEPNDIIYTMIFKATRSGKLSDMLNISNRGLTAESYDLFLEMDLSNSVSDERALIYVAKGLKQVNTNPDDTEVLDVIKKPFREVLKMVMQGEITDSMSVAGILKLAYKNNITI